MQTFLRSIAISLLLTLLQGCYALAERTANTAPPFADPARQVQGVQITLTPEVQGEVWDNESIKPGRIVGAMRRNLKARNMLGKPGDRSLPRLEVVITDVRARSQGMAQWWGFMAGEDRIIGHVSVIDAEGKEIDRVKVSTAYAWGGFAGNDYVRANWMYDNFAERALQQLTGRSLPEEEMKKIASTQS